MKKYFFAVLAALLLMSVGTFAQNTKLVDIEGIDPKYAESLEKAGVKNQADLLAKGKSKKGREELSSKTGISETLILKWVNRADLAQVKGIGTQYADLLEASGVDSPAELATRNSENLLQRLAATNKEKKLVKKLPSKAVVDGWISAAKASKVEQEPKAEPKAEAKSETKPTH